MKTSTRENDEIEKLNDHFSNSEDAPTHSKGVSRILKPTLITILSLLCLTGGIVLHKLHKTDGETLSTKKYESYSVSTSLNLLKENTAIPSDNPLKSSTTLSTLTSLSPVKTVPDPLLIENETPMNTLAEKTDVTPTTLETSPLPIETAKPVSQPSFLDGFTLGDALKFKENFLAENDCSSDYQKLLNVPNKTTQALAVLNDLSPYCLHNQKPVQNVLEAFLKDKKEAIIAFYKHNNPAWLAYLKSIPISLIEIRRINPIKNSPKNILYKAQNALISQNVENAVNLVTQLPLYMQQKMDAFYREASIYNRSLQSLDQLILSFERKGE